VNIRYNYETICADFVTNDTQSSTIANSAKTGNSPQLMETFDQTACKLVEVGLRSDEYHKLSRIYRRKPIPYDEEHVPIARAKRNAAGS
jgi:hypothetical protein